MDLATRYLGFDLPHPFIVGASYLTEDLGRVRQLEDAGAAAVVLPSLFEEQVIRERALTLHQLEAHDESFGEAQSFLPKPEDMKLGMEPYLENLLRIKAAVAIPVIASLNGVTDGGWLDFARMLEQAGADALELNVYFVATNPGQDGQDAERKLFDIVRHVRQVVTIPIAVKLSPYYSSVANIAHRLDEVGADGLVLFNRFFQPDIDIEAIEIKPTLKLSDSSELPLRLAWLGILAGHVQASLAVTGGVHRVEDAVKAVMSGADAIQMVASLLLNGIGHLTAVRDGVARWLEAHDYDSLAQAKGSMSLVRCPDPGAYQRQNYMKMVQNWQP